jgi:preprotein translocase subunit SecY
VPELATRVLVTLGVLAIYRLGATLPLPGLDAPRLYERGLVTGYVPSVFTLGVVPLISVLLLVEIARLISKRFNDWAGATPARAWRINRWALAGALLLAAGMAYGVAVALEGISDVVDVVAIRGPEFQLAVVTTLVGGTALLAWLATLISRHGVGSGLWVLALAPWLAGLPDLFLQYRQLVQLGVLHQAGLISILAYVLIAVGSIAALGLVLARRGMPLERVLIWPLYIGTFLANFLWVGPWLVPAVPLRHPTAWTPDPKTLPYLAALAVVIIAVSLAQWRRVAPRSAGSAATPVAPPPAALVVLTALALAAVAVAPPLLEAAVDGPVPIGGIQITTAVGIILGMKSLLPSLESEPRV